MKKKIQSFNDGLVSIYSLTNVAEPGKMPIKALSLKRKLRYAERVVGLQRYNTGLQNNVQVRYVLRCPLLRDVSPQDIAVPLDGVQYRIWQVQYPPDVFPACMDLTLEIIEQKYEVRK